MKQNERTQNSFDTVSEEIQQDMRDSYALRQKLGIVGNKFTAEQAKAYMNAKRELWLERHPGAISGGPEPRPIPQPKSQS